MSGKFEAAKLWTTILCIHDGTFGLLACETFLSSEIEKLSLAVIYHFIIIRPLNARICPYAITKGNLEETYQWSSLFALIEQCLSIKPIL